MSFVFHFFLPDASMLRSTKDKKSRVWVVRGGGGGGRESFIACQSLCPRFYDISTNNNNVIFVEFFSWS